MLKGLDTTTETEEIPATPTLDDLAREGARRMLMAALQVEVAQYVDAHQEARDASGRRLVVRHGQAEAREGHVWGGHSGGASAAGARQAGRCHGPARAVHQPDPSALHAPVPQGGRGAADSLSPRVVHGRLPRSAARAAGRRRGRAERDQHRAADRGLGRRVSAVPAARPGRSGLRLCLGRRDSLQHPAGGRPPVHAGGHRRARRRDEGARRARGRVPRKCRRAGRNCCEGCSAAGSRRPWSRLAMGPWGSGAPSGTCGPRRPSNATGSTSWEMSWTSSRNVSSPRPSARCTTSWRRRRASRPRNTSTPSSRSTRRSIRKRPRVWRPTGRRSWTFFAFPADHWIHLRTTNVIESPFATVRLRQRVTKGAGSRTKGLLMAYKLLDMAQPAVAATQCRTPAAARAGWCGLHRRSAAGTKHRGGSEGSRLITLIADPQLLAISQESSIPKGSKLEPTPGLAESNGCTADRRYSTSLLVEPLSAGYS